MSATSEPSAWAQAMAQLAEADDRTAAMRERGESVDGDVYRTMLGALMDVYLTRINGEADHPRFMPTSGYFQRFGFPNTDTTYRKAVVVDDDGALRVVVANSDPGVQNWLDTTGYHRGVLELREIGSAGPPTITTQVVPLSSVLAHLPADTVRVTPEERMAALAQRRTSYQLRCQ